MTSRLLTLRKKESNEFVTKNLDKHLYLEKKDITGHLCFKIAYTNLKVINFFLFKIHSRYKITVFAI